jgi:hypothetical protein
MIEKIAVLIDFKSAAKSYEKAIEESALPLDLPKNSRLDFNHLIELTTDASKEIKKIIFLAKATEDQKMFISHLFKSGFDIRERKFRPGIDFSADISICALELTQEHGYTEISIVSGNPNLECVIRKLVQLGIMVRIIASEKSISPILIGLSPEIITFEEIGLGKISHTPIKKKRL